MKLLVLDACGVEAGVALGEDGRVVALETLAGRSASERLMTMIREMLEGAGWRLAELAAIGVVHGPGSFTGVRVGVSAAKGMSEASGVGLVAVSRLKLLVRLADGQAVALDAGRGEFYVRRDGEESLRTREELAAFGVPVTVFEESAAEALRGEPQVRLARMPGAEEALVIVAERVRAGCFDEAATLDANYLRRSERLYGRTVG